MKKIGLYLLGLLATVGFAACDDKSDLGIEQENPQENIMEANGLQVAYQSAIEGNSIDLNNYQNKTIPVISTVEAENLPQGATVDYEMQIASTADFTDAQTIEVEDGAVACSAWDAAFKTIYGNNPAARVNYIRFAAYVIDGTQISRLGGEDFWYASKQLNVTPIDLKLPVDATYYLYENGEFVKMDHSSQHQYDDPNFSLVFEVTAAQASDGFKWHIVNETYLQNANSGKFYGVSETGDASALSGNLELNGTQGIINAPGTYKMEVNMLNLTYTISFAFDQLNTPGPANGWSFDNNMNLSTTDYKVYSGYVYIQEEFKLAAGSWDVNWGMGASEGTLAPGGANIKVSENGLYYVVANLQELTYSLVKINNIGLIGGFNDWGSQLNMTPSADYKTWTVDVTFAGESEWKFRMNDNWDYNLGGTYTNLVGGGDNLKTAAGSYTITLDLSKIPYSCTVTAK